MGMSQHPWHTPQNTFRSLGHQFASIVVIHSFLATAEKLTSTSFAGCSRFFHTTKIFILNSDAVRSSFRDSTFSCSKPRNPRAIFCMSLVDIRSASASIILGVKLPPISIGQSLKYDKEKKNSSLLWFPTPRVRYLTVIFPRAMDVMRYQRRFNFVFVLIDVDFGGAESRLRVWLLCLTRTLLCKIKSSVCGTLRHSRRWVITTWQCLPGFNDQTRSAQGKMLQILQIDCMVWTVPFQAQGFKVKKFHLGNTLWFQMMVIFTKARKKYFFGGGGQAGRRRKSKCANHATKTARFKTLPF